MSKISKNEVKKRDFDILLKWLQDVASNEYAWNDEFQPAVDALVEYVEHAEKYRKEAKRFKRKYLDLKLKNSDTC